MIPAKAGTQIHLQTSLAFIWIPAFGGTSGKKIEAFNEARVLSMTFKSLVSTAALLGAAAFSGGAFAQTDGATLFQQNCSACHQPMGQGVPGAFPALVGDKLLLGDPKGPAYVVTHGRGGMPNFSEDLTDEQISTILTFVRSSWGNKAGPVDAATVKEVRSASAPPNNEAGLPFH
jgi:mono/diheme cytochrome c family protein